MQIPQGGPDARQTAGDTGRRGAFKYQVCVCVRRLRICIYLLSISVSIYLSIYMSSSRLQAQGRESFESLVQGVSSVA
jgi:hypothetical protein